MSSETVVVERRGRVGIIRLNRPQALNALNITLKDELLSAAEGFDADFGIGCIVIAGSEKVFAAGADIKEMADKSYTEIFAADYPADYERLARAVGKAKAMDLILTGRMMDAAEAERSGLVARVVPATNLMEEAVKVAEIIAAMSLPSVLAAKEAINRAFEMSLAEGVRFERRVFHGLFATRDQKEGMSAFIEKRPAKFENR